MPFRIIHKKNGYQVQNIETGKLFSKKPMTELNAIKQFKILNRYLNTMQGSGLNKGEIKQLRENPLTDRDIRKILGPNVKILSHQELKNYDSIQQILPKTPDICVIIYETKPNYGHWVLLSRYIDSETGHQTIEYFDSYGGNIDNPLNWIEKDQKKNIDSTPYLTKLLIKAGQHFDIVYNSKDFQKEGHNISTCGRHVVLRAKSIMQDHQTLSDYIKQQNEIKNVTGFGYDDIASSIIDI